MKVGHLAIHRKTRRIVNVVSVRHRKFLCMWFAEGEDPRKPGAKLEGGEFWEHQLNFDANAVRARATELGLDEPLTPAPDPGSGNM